MAVTKSLLVGMCIASLGVLLHIIGMATPHWMEINNDEKEEESIGLFQYCQNDHCANIPSDQLRSQDKAVQAMAILGVLAGGAGALGAIAFVTLTRMGQHPISMVRLASGLLCIAASVFIIVCIAVYAAKIYEDVKGPAVSLGYSFGLTTSGGVLLLLAGCVIVAKRGSQDEAYTS